MIIHMFMAERVGLFPNYSKTKRFRQCTDRLARLRYFERYMARYILASRHFDTLVRAEPIQRQTLKKASDGLWLRT
jgi:hypothetical protein